LKCDYPGAACPARSTIRRTGRLLVSSDGRQAAMRVTLHRSNFRRAGMTIESQIIEFLANHRGKLFCHPCIRQNVTLPNLREVEMALRAIGQAATFRYGDDECSECRRARPVVGAK
jgi:hypothetical protein